MSAFGTKQTSVCALQMSALNQSGHGAHPPSYSILPLLWHVLSLGAAMRRRELSLDRATDFKH